MLSIAINGDGAYRRISGSSHHWLGPKVGGHLALFCIHQINEPGELAMAVP